MTSLLTPVTTSLKSHGVLRDFKSNLCQPTWGGVSKTKASLHSLQILKRKDYLRIHYGCLRRMSSAGVKTLSKEIL